MRLFRLAWTATSTSTWSGVVSGIH